jgi:hypothetical protein
MLLAATTSDALAADIRVDSATLLGIRGRDVNGASKESLMPATQFLGLNAEKLLDGKLSIYLSGWGRADLADKSYNSETTSGSLTYGYLYYRFDQANAGIRAGRLFVSEGIINEQVDGFSARTDLPMGFGLSTFGGAVVHSATLKGEKSDGKGDTLYGGRANYRYKGLLEIGLSGVYESDVPTLATRSTGNYRRVGSDLWLTPHTLIDIIGHSSYNPESEHFAEHSYLVNVKPLKKVTLAGEFNQNRDQSFLSSATTFSTTVLNPNATSSSIGLIATYEINTTLEVAADYKYYSRDFGKAARFGGDARFKYRDNSIRGGIGYHYLSAGQGFAIAANPSASYHELRCYAMQETKSYFGAIDLLGDFFTEKIYNQSSAWEVTTSLGYHLTPALALSADLSYGRNPQFSEETKALLRLTYTTTYLGNGGKK